MLQKTSMKQCQMPRMLDASQTCSLSLQRRCFAAAGPRLQRVPRASRSLRTVFATAGPSPPYNVVITGSTKGVGRALAEAFLQAGDNVCVSSRSDARVNETVKALQADGKQHRGSYGSVKGVSANVAKPADVEQLARFASQSFGGIDLWICNAGSNAYSYVPLAENNVQDLVSIVETNTLGTMLCTREAIRVMRDQPTGGHIFLMDGAGADGGATPRFAAYGSTKRGLAQFQKSISAELKLQKLDNVVVHNLSPGMVTTELLMAGADSSKVARFFINCLAEEPKDVAEYLVPLVRKVPQESSSKSTYIRALTKPKAYSQIAQRLLMGKRKDRFVTEE